MSKKSSIAETEAPAETAAVSVEQPVVVRPRNAMIAANDAAQVENWRFKQSSKLEFLTTAESALVLVKERLRKASEALVILGADRGSIAAFNRRKAELIIAECEAEQKHLEGVIEGAKKVIAQYDGFIAGAHACEERGLREKLVTKLLNDCGDPAEIV